MKSVCGGCGLTFTGVSAFDKHRVGDHSRSIYNETGKVIGRTPSERHCLTVPEIEALGMIQNDRGWWHDELDEAGREKFQQFKAKMALEGK